MRGLAQHVAGLLGRQRREKFQEQRQEIRQFGRAHEQAGFLVLRLEVDHGLTAVAALAMHVLEQMQGQRTRMIEQQHVALLQIVKIVGGEFRQQFVQSIAHAERYRRVRFRSPR